MICRGLYVLMVCSVSCAVLAALAAQDEPNETAENTTQAKSKIAVLLAKRHIVQSLDERDSAGAKLGIKGRSLVERKYESIISEFREKHGLEKWAPDEAEELIAMRSAASEFLEALVEARDNVRRKAAAKKKGTTAPTGPAINLWNGMSNSPTEIPLGDLNKWRGDVIRQGDMFCQNLQSNAEEKDIRNSWKAIQNTVIDVFDRLHPVLLADKHVSNFRQENLLQAWDRLGTKEDLTVRVAGCTKVQMVSYRIVDAYGVSRLGSVAIGLFGATSWDVLKENNAKGGFYELVSVDP
jgi:hypothetical protein